MYFSKTIAVFQVIISCYIVSSADTNVSTAFVNIGIVPNVISTAPTGYLRVVYSNGTVDLGNTLTLAQVAEQPTVSTYNSTNSTTLVMLAPGVPGTQANLWIVTNIASGNVTSGTKVASYLAPYSNAYNYSYIFLVYEQASTLTLTNNTLDCYKRDNSTDRLLFNVTQFVSNCSLSGPTYGNFFKMSNVVDVSDSLNYVAEIINNIFNSSTTSTTST